MNGILKACTIAIAVGISVHTLGAEPTTPRERRSLPINAAALPDWSGEWEMVGLTPHDGGLYVESAEQIAVRWKQPQFTDDLVQRAFRANLTLALMNALKSGVGFGFACTFGFPMLMLEAPATFEVLATTRQTSLIFSTREVRNIYTDGRPHTPNDEIWPTYWGDSVGHWEGQTLVIDTIAVTSAFLPVSVKQASNAAAAIGLSGGSNGAPPQGRSGWSQSIHSHGLRRRLSLPSSGEDRRSGASAEHGDGILDRRPAVRKSERR